MEENTKILERIKSIADKLCKNNAVMMRADLAYELQDLGVNHDSPEISKLVWSAYLYYNKNTHIKKAFYDNKGRRSLVESYMLYDAIDQEQSDQIFYLLEQYTDSTSNSISEVGQMVDAAISGAIAKVASGGVMEHITGTSGVIKVKSEAAAVFNGYSNLVNAYDIAKGEIKNEVTNFTYLRNEIDKVFQQYVMALTDVFGDSIKSIAPEMFDFDQIQWLDVTSMFKAINLQYDKLSDECTDLLGEISDSFSASLKQSSSDYQHFGKTGGLLIASINMFGHYAMAHEETNRLKEQLLTLKNNVKYDATKIKGDMGRLTVIYRNLDEQFIPAANAFLRYSDRLLSKELKQLLDSIYQNPEIQAMKESRDTILEQYKTVNNIITDNKLNIGNYSSHIADCKQQIDKKRPLYKQALSCKPHKPFFLFNMLTLGSLGKSYRRDLYEWSANYEPLINSYDNLKADIKLDEEELKVQQSELKENSKNFETIKAQLDSANRKMMSFIQVDDIVKKRMSEHLNSIVRLLRAGRSIIESRIEDRFCNTVTIGDPKDLALPENVERNIANFTKSLKDVSTLSNEQVGRYVNGGTNHRQVEGTQKDSKNNSDIESRQKTSLEEQDCQSMDEEGISRLTEVSNDAVEKAASLVGSWLRLNALKAQSEINNQSYDEELSKLQQSFKKEMVNLNKRGVKMREILRKIHTSENDEELIGALASLSGDGEKSLSNEEMEQFINGNKTINI